MNAPLVAVPAENEPLVTIAGVSRGRLIERLKGLLRASFELRAEGASYARLAHTQGYADGFMRCLVTAGVVTERELLEIVRDTRRGLDGPSTRRLEPEETWDASCRSA